MSPLTDEQRARIEENRKKALEKRALKARIEANRQKALAIQAARRKLCQNGKPLTSVTPLLHPSESSLGTSIDDKVKSSNTTVHKINQFTNLKQTTFTNNSLTSVTPNMKKVIDTNIVHGWCHLVSTDYFSVNIGFHRRVIDIFKSIKSASYDSLKKRWKFHIRDHDKLMKELTVLKGEVSITELPRNLLNLFLNPVCDFRSLEIDLSKIDSNLLEKVMPFQREGILFGISRRGRCLIADDMGLGKTIQALGIAHYYQEDWPLLIVCPTSVRYQWMEAIHCWLPSIPAYTINMMTSKNDYDPTAKILITSYNMLTRYANVFKNSFGMTIVDESHFMKNYSSARTKTVCAVLKTCKRVILLTGTPALSRPMELFTQINAIDPKTFPNFQAYGIRYCAGKKSNMGFWDYNGCSNMEELNLVLKQSVMIRRLKSDVLSQLPSKMRQMVILNSEELSSKQGFKEFEKALQSKSLIGMERRGTLLQYYAYSGKHKIPKIVDYINDQLERRKKFIIFAHHKIVLDAISDAIANQNVDFIRIDGSTSSLARKEMCDKFQFNDDCLVAVLSITAANAGLTLTAAHLVIFAELFWNPGILTQAEDRAHRIGQEDCVLVQYLVSPGTADDHLWPLIQTKLEVLNKAGLSKDSFQSSATSSVKFERQSQYNITDFFDSLDVDDLSEF